MLHQVFQVSDIGTIGFLVLLEALLSADNALILAIMVRHLPNDERRKALYYGLAGALVLRLVAIIFASTVIGFWWLQGLGAVYLIFLPAAHFLRTRRRAPEGKEGAGFWLTVLYADLADVAFAIDSILVAIAIEPHRNKIWVVYCGAVIGIVLLRLAVGGFLRLLERYPVLDHVAYALVGWAGVKLAFMAGNTYESWFPKAFPTRRWPIDIPEMSPLVFWVGIVVIGGIGTYLAVRRVPGRHPPTVD